LLALEGPGPVRVYLDRFLQRLNDLAELDYEEWRGKFWLRHPELDR
jgi:hypothetical protein